MSQAFGANIILIVVALIILIIIIACILAKKATFNTNGNCQPPPPDECCTQDTCSQETGCMQTSTSIQTEPLCDQPEPAINIPKAVAIIDDISHPSSVSSILKVTADQLSRPAFGYFKLDSDAVPLRINTATCDPRGNLYIHIENETLSGIYRLDKMMANNLDLEAERDSPSDSEDGLYEQESKRSSCWQYLAATGKSHFDSAIYDLRDHFDTVKTNHIISIYLDANDETKLYLVTLAGVFDLEGNSVDEGNAMIYRSGKYSITVNGELYQEGFKIRLPTGVTLNINEPLQVIDFSRTHNSVKYGYLCYHQSQRGIILVLEEGCVFLSIEATSFALVEGYLVCLDYEGAVYRRALSSENFEKLTQLELDERHNIIVGGGEACYVISTYKD